MPQAITLPLRVVIDPLTGQSVPGAKAYFYDAGTTVPLAVYSDAGLTTTITQPVTADNAGVLPVIYLSAASSYKLTLNRSNGSLIYTVDPVAIAGLVKFDAIGIYRIDSNIDVSVDGTRIVGDGIKSKLLMSGNNRRAFAVTGNGVTMDDLYIDGQKPTVGWETSNNYDFGARIGEGVSSVVSRFTARNLVIKDVGLDGIYLGNVNEALIESCDFINCRRAGVAVVSGTYGIKNVTLRNVRFFCDFNGGPSGKERPLFAVDFEPDPTDGPMENAVLDGFLAHQGRVSMVGTPPAVIINGAIRNGDIVGAYASLAIDACAPEVSSVRLLNGAYALIDNTPDSFPANPYIVNLQAGAGRTQEFNADGRANLLPRDCICSADGSSSVSGGGTIDQEYHILDGVPCTVSAFRLSASTGEAKVAIPTAMGIAAGDNVWILLEVERSDGNNNDDAVVIVKLGSTVDRTYSVTNGRRWISIAVKATAIDNDPNFTFGMSGTPAANMTVRCYRAFVFINPAVVDMPSLKVGKSSPAKTFNSWVGPNLLVYNFELCVLNAASGQNLDSIKGAIGQIVGLQSVGAGAITVRDAGTSGVSANNGGLKLPGGGTATLTYATFRRHSDGYWYRV